MVQDIASRVQVKSISIEGYVFDLYNRKHRLAKLLSNLFTVSYICIFIYHNCPFDYTTSNFHLPQKYRGYRNKP